ncbi:MAG: hypothetical protein ACRDTF_24420 [Pseudonocardiaceae bacterium]
MTFALATSAIFAGLTVTTAGAEPNGYIYLCKQAAPGSGVTGTFTFTVINPPAGAQNPQDPQYVRTVQVPVGGCSAAIMIARPSPQGIKVTETPANGTYVSKIDVPSGTITVPHKKFSPTITVADDASTNDAKGPGAPGKPGTITFTNDRLAGSVESVGPVDAVGPGGTLDPRPEKTVCPPNFWAADLKTGAKLGALPIGSGIGPITNSQAVVTLDLQPRPGIKCKRANIVVEYEGAPTGWTVDIGDSPSNNGFGGGGQPNLTDSCAEVQVLNSVVSAFKDCGPGNAAPLPLSPTLPAPLSLKDSSLKFVVENGYLSVGQPFASATDTQSFHLPDTTPVGVGTSDGSKIYAAFNRVIANAGRAGTGVRRVMITLE